MVRALAAGVNPGRLVQLQVDGDGLAWLRLCDAAGRNRFTRALVAQLKEGLEALADPRVKACVLCGLEDVFCGGADPGVLHDLAAGRVRPYDLRLTAAVLDVPVPTVAAMAGAAVGGGLILGLGCDLVFLAEESRYGCNFMDLGFTPGMGATALVKAAFGEYLAAELLFGGGTLRGTRLRRASLVNDIVPRAEVETRAAAAARRFCDKERPLLERLKRTLSLPRRRAFAEALTLEAHMHETCFADPGLRRRLDESYPAAVGDGGREP